MTVQELYDSIGGDYEAAKRVLTMDKLIGKFIIRLLSDKSCEKLLLAASGKDNAALFEAAHSLKGVCANLGLLNISGMASEIAEEFRPGNSRKLSDDAVSEKIAALKEAYSHAISKINEFSGTQG